MATRLGAIDWLSFQETYSSALEGSGLETYRRRRWQRCQEFAGWLTQVELASLSEKEVSVLYRASGGNRTKEFNSNPIEEVRDSLDFLLYDTITLEGRFEECAADDGGFKLVGAGKEFVSYVLCVRDSALFAVWTSHAERLLRRVGIYRDGLRGKNLGMWYMDLLEVLQRVRREVGLADFRSVDEFAYAVTRPGNRPAA